MLTDREQIRELAEATRCLVLPCLANTLFASGQLNLASAREVRLHTIFSRRDRGDIPYLLSALAADIERQEVHRATISSEVEASIRILARLGPSSFDGPTPVIVEADGECLILEGNKRFVALALMPSRQEAIVPAWVGGSTLRWDQLVALYNMRPT